MKGMELSKDNFREEVRQFRATFKEDTLSNAEKSLFIERHGAVAVLVFDAVGSKANTLGTPIMLRLYELLLEIEKDKEIGAVVLISRKPTIFIAGADIAEIQRLNTEGARAADWIMKLQSIFTFLERLPIPSIAAINGACMGGATELSLSCDYRMATDAKETKIALPEVNLGVLPGWGGTQRMPRLVGLEKGLDLVLSGRALDGKGAKKIGLVDKVVPKEVLEAKAIAWAKELAKSRIKRDKDEHHTDLKGKLMESLPGKWLVFDQAKKKLLEKTKGHYPAPLKALEVIRKTYGGDLDAGLKIEAQAFGELVTTPESKNLVNLFYLNEKVKKDKGTETGVPGREVKKGGVLGAGVMGGGIAQLFAAKGVRVRMKDVNWESLTKGFGQAYKIFKKQVDRRKMKPSELDNAMARIEGTTTYHGFKNADIVIEAVVEDLEVKRKVFKELEEAVSPQTILATNTSSLSVSSIAEGVKDPKRVVGMHFFNPVDKMPLVEVVRAKESSEEAVATTYALAKRMGKTPIVVKDSPGFVVNRLVVIYILEGVNLIMEGMTVAEIDKLMESFGMPMGPARLFDEVGLDVGVKVVKIHYGAYGDRYKPPSAIDIVANSGLKGKKGGKGFYLYEKDGKAKGTDPTFLNKISIPKRESTLTDEVAQKRVLYLMVNEAARLIEEKVVRDLADIDVGVIFGMGFPPFRGGLLRYADSVGIDTIVSELDVLKRNYGPRFEPCNYLQQLAVAGKKFYEAG
jgi:3-hydroxyacyl-CoA dehydrogenase/enoyl-CoA hydratase/3-hydroxybutyryl-CoA epimerase